MYRIIYFVIVSLFCAHLSAAQKIEDYFSYPKFRQVKLSPDGENIAFTFQEDSEVKLGVLNLKKNKILSTFGLGENMHVLSFYWGNKERLIFSAGKVTGNLDNMGRPQHFYGANIDGSKRKIIFEMQRSFMRVANLLPDDEDYILIEKRHWADNSVRLHRLNIYDGRLDYLEDQPSADNIVGFITDNQGKARVAIEYVEKEGTEEDDAFLHVKRDNSWNKLAVKSKRETPQFQPLGFSKDNNVAYFSSDLDSADAVTSGVFSYNFVSDEISFVERNAISDVVDAARDYSGAIIGFSYMPGYFEHTYLDNEDYYTKLLKGLRGSFPQLEVNYTSFTRDGKTAIVRVNGDKDPGTFYILDVEQVQLRYLADVIPQLDKKNLVEVKPIEFKARDGLTIRGYLTMPKGKNSAPMIINVHGGPFGVTDMWGYEPEAQYFAAHGYATLQVNYRGSGGYGKDFERAGYRQWGWKMQDDVTDATLWAIEQGLTSKDSVCIYGGSYGGYATLRGITKEPDLYKCAVGYVGVYDMLKFFNGDGSDASRNDGIKRYLERQVAANEEAMLAISPAHQVEKIKTPLFVVHGKNDVRVPMPHYDSLTGALKKAGVPFKSMVKDEGHGFYKMKNRVALYSEMLDFFNEHIGNNIESK